MENYPKICIINFTPVTKYTGRVWQEKLKSPITIITRDGRPAPRGTLPAGRGGFPAPPCTVGRGGVPHPDPPRKNDQNCGEVAGQNKGLYLNFLQKRKLMMEQYHNTEHE